MEVTGISTKTQDLRSLSSALSLWLIVLVGTTGFYFTDSGHEILVQSSESWGAAIRLLLAESLLVFAAQRHLAVTQKSRRARLLTALIAAIPLGFVAIAFRASAHEFAHGPHAWLNRISWIFFIVFFVTVVSLTLKPLPIRGTRRHGIFSWGIIVVFLLTACFPTAMGSLLGTAGCIGVWGCFALCLYGLLEHFRDRLLLADTARGRIAYRVLVFAPPILVVWFVIGLGFNTHKARNLEHDATTLQEYSHWQMTLDTSLAQWYTQHQDADGVATMVLVETAGGGARAAYWTSSVLFTLDRVEGFREHLFAISAVSGGSLGATLYRAAIATNRPPHSLGDSYKRFYEHDFLGPLTAGWLYSDLTSTLLPIGLFPDRAEALERSWENAWKAEWGGAKLSDEFRKLWPALPTGYKPGDRLPMNRWPHLILNGSSLENGNVLITSDIKNLSFGSETLRRVEDVAPLRFPTSTAIDNSARFPVLGPPGMILFGKGTVQTYLHALGLPAEEASNAMQDIVVDGGYVDNFGAYTMAEILDHVREFNCFFYRKSLMTDKAAPVDTTGCASYERSDHAPGIVPIVIQITSDPSLLRGSMQPNECLDPPEGWKLEPPGLKTSHDTAPFTEVVAPAIAMDQMRQRNGIVFAAALADRKDIGAYFHFGIGPPYPVSGVLNRSEPPPSLNWMLSQHSKNQLDAFLSQCEHLQASELAIIIKDPHQAKASTLRRQRLEHPPH